MRQNTFTPFSLILFVTFFHHQIQAEQAEPSLDGGSKHSEVRFKITDDHKLIDFGEFWTGEKPTIDLLIVNS